MSHSPVATACLNCGRDLSGVYCSACGQKVTSFKLGLHDFFHEVTHEFLHLDGKVFRTMKLLVFSPGMLTREFVDGKRTRYISPVRLYLTWSVIFFSLIIVLGTASKAKYTIRKSDAPVAGVEVSVGKKVESRIEAGVERAKRNPEKMGETVAHSWPKAMFLLMPVFAAMVLLFYRKAEGFYIPHLYYSIHLHAFAFFLLSISVLIGSLNFPYASLTGILLLLLLVPYFLLSLRKVYRGGWGITLAKGFVIGSLYFVTFLLTMAGVVITSLLML